MSIYDLSGYTEAHRGEKVAGGLAFFGGARREDRCLFRTVFATNQKTIS
jgi:hypothetical protein